jgi:uncharacterized repeat protein (TIGR01451 family)
MVTPPEGTPSGATDTDALTPQADLAVTKTDGITAAVPGTATTYTLTVSNAGPSTVRSLTLSDAVPAALLNPVFGTPSAGSYDPLTGLWSGLSLAAGQSVNLTLTGTIDPAATGILTNTAHVAPPAGVTDPNPGDNNASDTDTLTPQADLSITKDDGRSSAVPGTATTYMLMVTNAGPSTVESVTLSDAVPAALLNPVFGTPSAGSYDPLTGLWSGLSLAAGQSITITLTGTIDPAATGTLSNSAMVAPPAGVTDPNPANDSATDTDTLTPEADLALSKTDGRTTAVPGTRTTYTLTVTNSGPSTLHNIILTDAAPAALLNPVFGTPSAGSYDPLTGLWSGLSLAAGQSVTLTLTGTIDPAATGTLTNTAHVAPPAGVSDTNPANNTASDTDSLTPEADLAILKSDGVTTVVPGTADTYILLVGNFGRSAVNGATVSDPLPAGVTAASWTFAGATGGGTVSGPTSGTGALATTVDLPVGATVTFTFSAQVSPAAAGTLVNTATVTPPAGVTDPDPANNSATDTDSLTPRADLAILKSDGVTSVVPGTATTYILLVGNFGPSAVSGASVSDPLPAGVTAASWTFAGATGGGTVSGPTSGTGALATTVDLPVGATVTFTFSAQVSPSATGTLVNTATVTPPAGVTDPDPANNSATDTDSLTPRADLAILKSDGVTSVVPGTATTYILLVSNFGPSAVSGASVSDPLPAGVTAAGWTFAGGTDGGTVSGPTSGAGALATTVDLPVGATVTFTFSAQVSPSATGTLVNTATITPPAGVTDPNAANNSATDTDTVMPPPQADVVVTKTVDNPLPIFDTPITYTINVSNRGPATATNVIVADPLPAGLVLINSVPSEGTFDGASGLWTVGTLANGATAVLQLTAQTAMDGPIVNNAVARADQLDPDLASNQATVVITVQLSPDQISKLPFLSSTILGNPTIDPALFPQNAQFVAQLYRDLLHREADALDLARGSDALDNGDSRMQLVQAIQGSPEYLGAEVDGIYSQLLHRAADPAGRNAFINYLENGGTVEQLEAMIAGSQEYFQQRGGGTNDGFLDALYQDGLNRAVDGFGRAAWDQALASGLSRDQVAARLFSSLEYDTNLVNKDYSTMLRRPADAPGLNHWVTQLLGGVGGDQVLADILASDEYFTQIA